MKYLLATIFLLSSFSPTPVQAQSYVCPVSEHAPYMVAGNPTVWYVDSACKKSAMANEDVYFSYFDSWSRIETTTQETLNTIYDAPVTSTPWGIRKDLPNGSIVKRYQSPTVYVLQDNELYRFVSEDAFLTSGYAWEWVEMVDSAWIYNKNVHHARGRTNNPVIDGPSWRPPGTIVKQGVDLYVVDGDSPGHQGYTYISSMDEFRTYNFREDRIVPVQSIASEN